MASIRDNIKRGRGRPATGKGVLIGVRLQPGALARVDKWAKSEGDAPSRPEALRRLVEMALSTVPKDIIVHVQRGKPRNIVAEVTVTKGGSWPPKPRKLS